MHSETSRSERVAPRFWRIRRDCDTARTHSTRKGIELARPRGNETGSVNACQINQVTQQDSFDLCQRGIPVARRPIPTSASLWRGQNMLYSRPNYAFFHRALKQ